MQWFYIFHPAIHAFQASTISYKCNWCHGPIKSVMQALCRVTNNNIPESNVDHTSIWQERCLTKVDPRAFAIHDGKYNDNEIKHKGILILQWTIKSVIPGWKTQYIAHVFRHVYQLVSIYSTVRVSPLTHWLCVWTVKICRHGGCHEEV